MTAIYIYNGISEIKQGGLLMLGDKIKSLRLEKDGKMVLGLNCKEGS